MPALKNAKWEAFCQHLVKDGNTVEQAHILAGFAHHRQNAYTLFKRKPIKDRYDELMERRHGREHDAHNRAVERLAITKESVLAELAKIAFANMQDYMKVGEDGQPSLNFKDLTRDQAAALAEITVEEFVDGRSDKRRVRRVKFKLASKQDALVALGKHLGLFIERHEIGGPGDFARMTDDELQQALVGQAEALGLPEDAIAGLLTYRKTETEPESTEQKVEGETE